MVYVFFADGFEEVEAITPVDYLRRAGIPVETVGVFGTEVTGAHNITIKCDRTMENVSESALPDMIVLPGGMPGVTNLAKSEKLLKIINLCFENNKFIAAICAAPTILAELGILKGKTATCFPSMANLMENTDYVNMPVVRDKNFITSRAAGSAEQFALELISVLKGKDCAQKIHSAIFAR